MLPKVVHDESAAWPPEPASGVRVRTANFDRELSAWFEDLAAPTAEEPEEREEARSARIPFLIY